MNDPKRTPSDDKTALPDSGDEPADAGDAAREGAGHPAGPEEREGERAKEWGERREAGKAIGRGGKDHGPADGVPDPDADESR